MIDYGQMNELSPNERGEATSPVGEKTSLTPVFSDAANTEQHAGGAYEAAGEAGGFSSEQLRAEVDGLTTALLEARATITERDHTISVVEAERDQARREARTDPLTGLPNRLALKEELDKIIDSRNALDGAVYAFMMIDIDKFKGVNDDISHNYGDKVLQAIARHLRDAVRSDDFPVRIGGDEFLVVARISTDGIYNDEQLRSRMDAIRDRLREDVERFLPEANEQVQGFGVSAGYVSLTVGSDTSAKTMEDVMQRIDARMYADKEDRRPSDEGHDDAELSAPLDVAA